MYKIGEFARLVNTSIRTLRYYDEIGILKPDYIDIFTNYRYYTDNKINDYHIIEELKDVGFTLSEIKQYSNKFDEKIMLRKKEELYQEQQVIDDKIKKLDHMRSRILNGTIVSREIKLEKRMRR